MEVLYIAINNEKIIKTIITPTDHHVGGDNS